MLISIRRLDKQDANALDKLLSPHTAEAYYLRSNALASGLSYEGKALQAEYFGAFSNGQIIGAIAYSWMHSILLYASDLECLPSLAQAIMPSIIKRGGVIEAILGLAPQVDAVIGGLRISKEAFRRWDRDGLFLLSLDSLSVRPLPEGFSIRLAAPQDRETLIGWRMAFNVEANGAASGDQLKAKAEKEIDLWLKSKDTFLLEDKGTPVSFCGIGGEVPEMAIIGPVWTPSEYRNRGYAKLVTGNGLKMRAADKPLLSAATLFASRPDAVRAYESLGFKRIADWRLVLLKEDYRFCADVADDRYHE